MKTKLHFSPFPTNHVSRTVFHSARFLSAGLLFASLLYLGFSLPLPKIGAIARSSSSHSSGIKNQAQCPTCAPRGDQVIYSPLIDLQEAKGCEIVLNSRSPHEIEVTPTFYKTDGTPIIGDPVRVQSTEMRFVDLKKLIPGKYRNDRDWGGMSLAYTGAPREIWAQLKMLRINRGGSVDALFAVPQESRSAILESVWWMPKNSEAIIALGNITDVTTSATVTFGGGQSQPVTLAPHATEVIRHRHLSSAGGESVTINTNGPAGSVIPTGVIASADGEFNSIIRFYDPKTAKQPHLFGNGLGLKGTTPRMVLKNTSSTTIIATPQFIPLAGIEASKPVILPALTLDPGEVIEANLSRLSGLVGRRNDLNAVSVEVQSSGDAGSLIGALYSTDGNAQITYDVPLRDSGPASRSQGSYPIRLEGDFTTLVSITNVSPVVAKFTASINYEGGRYFPRIQSLGLGETAVFDIKRMRDESTPDGLRNTLPLAMTKGQFHWSVYNATDGAILIGRAEVISPSSGSSSSFSCPMICADSYVRGGAWDYYTQEDTLDLEDGEQGLVEGWEIRVDPYGYESGPTGRGVGSFTSFEIVPSGIATVSMNGNYYSGVVTGLEGGDGDIYTCWNSTVWYSDDQGFCNPTTVIGGGEMNIRVTKVRIENEAGNNLAGTNQNAIVGEHIRLYLRTIPARSFTDLNWNITGTHKKNWNVVPPTSDTDPVSTASYESTATNDTPVNFFWHDGDFNGKAETVTMTLKINGKSRQRSVNYHVFRPLVDVTATKGEIKVDSVYDPSKPAGIYLHFGIPVGAPGNDLKANNITIPLGLTGHWQWVRTISADRTSGPLHASGYGLDLRYPSSLGLLDEDSPAQQLTSGGADVANSPMICNDAFDTYLMFKPDLPNAHWVPMKKIHWNWFGTATKSFFGTWSLQSQGTDTTTVSNWVDFPTWGANYIPNFR